MRISDVTVSWRTEGVICSGAFVDIAVADLRRAEPWRVLRSFHGSAHYAGWYWSATTKGPVTYESRLELCRLLLADHDPSVKAIVSQPFLLQGEAENGRRRHIPDFLLVDECEVATVVNVKPLELLSKPRIVESLGWAKSIVEARGWKYETWSTVSPLRLANVRFLSGYRRTDRCDQSVIQIVAAHAGGCLTVGELEASCAELAPAPLVRPAVLHLIWTGQIETDLEVPLCRQSPISVPRSRVKPEPPPPREGTK